MAFDIMRLTPLGSALIWYCQPGDWEHLKEDLPEMQNSNSFIDSLLLNLHRMCIKAEKTLLETLTGTGNLAVAQAAFSTYCNDFRFANPLFIYFPINYPPS